MPFLNFLSKKNRIQFCVLFKSPVFILSNNNLSGFCGKCFRNNFWNPLIPILLMVNSFNTLNKYVLKNVLKIKVSVNLFQKQLSLHQLTQNMTTDCSWNYQVSTGKFLSHSEALLFAEHETNILCTKNVLNVKNNFCTQHVLPMFWAWNFHVLNL